MLSLRGDPLKCLISFQNVWIGLIMLSSQPRLKAKTTCNLQRVLFHSYLYHIFHVRPCLVMMGGTELGL